MANIAKPNVKRIPWQEGMRVTGKYEMPVKDYGEYLMRSGKNKHNTLKRKKLMRAVAERFTWRAGWRYVTARD